MPSQVESFLNDFHTARPGATSKAFGALPVVFRGQQYASSYEVLAAAVPHVERPMEVLDIACGDGFLLSRLAARNQANLGLTGADMNSSELEIARARLGSAASFHQARAQELPFAPHSFDYVLCHLALMLMDDVEQVLREIRRVLRPGAQFAAIVFVSYRPTIACGAYIDVLSKYPRLSQFADIPKFGDRRIRDRDGMQQVLAANFRNISIEDLDVVMRLTPDELWLVFLDTYNLYLLDEAKRISFQREYLRRVAPHCGSDGKLEYALTLRYVDAVATEQ